MTTYFETELAQVNRGHGSIYVDGGLIMVTEARTKTANYFQFRFNGKRISREEAAKLCENYIEADKKRKEWFDTLRAKRGDK